MKGQFVTVYGRKYPVCERSGYIKAHLYDIHGWTFVWAVTWVDLIRRIRFVLEER